MKSTSLVLTSAWNQEIPNAELIVTAASLLTTIVFALGLF